MAWKGRVQWFKNKEEKFRSNQREPDKFNVRRQGGKEKWSQPRKTRRSADQTSLEKPEEIEGIRREQARLEGLPKGIGLACRGQKGGEGRELKGGG